MIALDLETDRGVKKRKGIPKDLKTRHAAALDYFKASASYFSKQRQREVDDLKFVDFDDQWEQTTKTQRAGSQAVNGLPPTPARPTPVTNLLRASCQQVANTRRHARLALEFAPKGGGATQDVAEVFEDIVRAAQDESRAAIARNWAADRAEKCGMGWYRIDADFSQEQPDDEASWNDQDIVWRRILNQASVYPDPTSQEPDFSDGRRLFITEDIPIARYRDEYPDSDLSDYDTSELTGIGDRQPEWVFATNQDADGDAGKTIRIAEYWEVIERTRTKVMLTDGRAAFDDEDLPEGVQIATGPQARRRVVRDRVIMWSKINAIEYLEEPVEWDGLYIPIVPCIGEEFNVDGERRWQGLVRPGKDSNVIYNVMNAARLETIGLATKAPYIGYFETIEPYLEWWKQSNVRNFFMLPIKAVRDAAGNFLPPPKRNVEEPAIQAITQAAQAAKDDVHSTTGIPPVALGQLDPRDRSGKAIQALQGQAEVGTSGYLDNFTSITLHYEGKVVRDMIPRKFDRPGRIVPAVGVDEKRRLVMLNYPYVEGPDGQPIKALPQWEKGQPVPKQIPGPPGQNGQSQPLEVKYYDLSVGQFSIAPVVGKSYATRREEASAAISAVMQAVPPEMAAAIAPAWLEEQDYPGARKVAEIAKKALPPQLAAAYQDDKSGPSPEVQQLQQQLQQAQEALKGQQAAEQAKQQAQTQRELTKTQMQEQGEAQRTQSDNQTRIEIARINQEGAFAIADLKATLEAANTAIAAMQAERLALESSHKEAALQVHQAAHEAAQNAADRAHALGMAAVQHAQTLEQGQQAADLAPTPEPTA